MKKFTGMQVFVVIYISYLNQDKRCAYIVPLTIVDTIINIPCVYMEFTTTLFELSLQQAMSDS